MESRTHRDKSLMKEMNFSKKWGGYVEAVSL